MPTRTESALQSLVDEVRDIKRGVAEIERVLKESQRKTPRKKLRDVLRSTKKPAKKKTPR